MGAVRFAHAVGNVVARSRAVGFAQSRLMVVFGALLLAIAAAALLWPRVVAIPMAIAAGWLGAALVVNGVRLRRQRGRPVDPVNSSSST